MEWADHEIYVAQASASALGPVSVFGVDVDADGDTDVIFGSGVDTVAWSENLDGSGGSWSYHEIYTALNGVTSVVGIDIDGDGDIDVLSASEYDPITWYENLDGSGGSWAFCEISAAQSSTDSVFGVDIDGDGDIDVLFSGQNSLSWYENLDGSGGSWSYHQIAGYPDLWGITGVCAIDLDGDGDVDVLSASRNNGRTAWYENLDGVGGSWSQHDIASASWSGATWVIATDIDGDGDLDVVTALWYHGDVVLYENLDGIGGSWSTRVLSTSGGGRSAVFAIDLDDDGDVDVLSSDYGQDAIEWYENLGGSGTSWSHHVINSEIQGGATSVFAIDVDGDSDIDVLSSNDESNPTARIMWCVTPRERRQAGGGRGGRGGWRVARP